MKWDWIELTQETVWTLEYALGSHKELNRQPAAVDTRVRSQAYPCGIGGVQCSTGTDISPGTSAFPCQYHYTNAPTRTSVTDST
jgi:hypothetical protein